jgi:hypothetical protein
MHVDRLKTLPISQNPGTEHGYILLFATFKVTACHPAGSEQYHSAFCLLVSQPSHFTDPIVLEMAPLPFPFLIGHMSCNLLIYQTTSFPLSHQNQFGPSSFNLEDGSIMLLQNISINFISTHFGMNLFI